MKETLSRAAKLAKLGLQTKTFSQKEHSEMSAKKFLAQRLSELKGLPNKIQQVMTMTSEEAVVDQSALLSLEEVEIILQESFSEASLEQIKRIEPRAFPASIGQVHRAELINGENLAVKIRYPKIEKTIKADLSLLNLLTVPFGGMVGFDMEDYQKEFRRNFFEEINYDLEKHNLEKLSSFQKESGIKNWIIPNVVSELSNEHILTTKWEDGISIQEASNWSLVQKEKLIQLIAEVHLKSIFLNGTYHSDPHPGNFSYRLDKFGEPELIMYDFGSVHTLSLSERLNILRLFKAVQEKEGINLYGVFIELGFDEKVLDPILDRIPRFIEILLEPFSSQGKFNVLEWDYQAKIRELVGDDKWNFRKAAPAKILFFMRTILGMFYYFKKLGGKVFLKPILNEVYSTFSKELNEMELPQKDKVISFANMADYLKILVTEHGRQKVNLTLKRECVDDLEELIPGEIRQEFKNSYNFKEIQANIQQSNYTAQDIISYNYPNSDKKIKIWLE